VSSDVVREHLSEGTRNAPRGLQCNAKHVGATIHN
jgi:hypothetical protein